MATLSKEQLRGHYRVSEKTIRNWLAKGCPHHKDARGRYQFDVSAVDHWYATTIDGPAKTAKSKSTTLAEAKLREHNVRIEREEFKLAKLKGEYVPRAKVDKYLFESGRQIRDAILGIPDRLAGIVTAETDQHKNHAVLTQELRRALESLSTELVKWDGGNYDPHGSR